MWFIWDLLALFGVVMSFKMLGILMGNHGYFVKNRPADREHSYALRTVIDQKGKVVSRDWVAHEWPDEYETRGLDHLGDSLDRLLTFEGLRAGVSIFSLDGQRGLSVDKEGGVISVSMIFPPGKKMNAAELRARSYYERLGWPIVEENLMRHRFGSRIVDWQAPNRRETLINAIRGSLEDLCGISSEEGLTYRFHAADAPPEPLPSGYRATFTMDASYDGRHKGRPVA